MARFSRSERNQLLAKLPELVEIQKLQQWKAAQVLGVSTSWVERACAELGLQTQRTGPRSGEGHPDWKGGRRKVGGYWYVYCPDHPNTTKQRYVAEHRLVMESVLGRFLLPTEVVHHMNGDPTDNRPENLEVFETNSEHLRHELAGRVPNWSPEGWARMQEGVQRSASRRRGKFYVRRHTQPNAHRP